MAGVGGAMLIVGAPAASKTMIILTLKLQ